MPRFRPDFTCFWSSRDPDQQFGPLDWMRQRRADPEGGSKLFATHQMQAELQLRSRKLLPSPVLMVDSMEKTPDSQ